MANFEQAAEDVKNLPTRPNNDELLKLYGLFKQATDGDVSGSKPGIFDLKGRKKFEAWEALKGKSNETAKTEYVTFVESLKKKYGV